MVNHYTPEAADQDRQLRHFIMPTVLTDIEQLRAHRPIYLGTSDEPCQIYSLPTGDYEKRQWIPMQIKLNDDELAVMQAFDAASPGFNDLVGDFYGNPCVTVRVSHRYTKFFDQCRSRRDRHILKVHSDVNIVVVPTRSICTCNGKKGKRGVHLHARVVTDVTLGPGPLY